MRKPNLKQVLIYGIAIFLSSLFSFIMDDLKLLGNAKYVYLVAGFVLFIIIVLILQLSWLFIPKIQQKYFIWKNKDRKADFQISDIGRSLFNKNLFLFIVQFPKDSNPLLFLDVAVKVQTAISVEKGNSQIDHIASLTKAMIKMKSADLSWRSGKNKIRMWKYSSELIDVFELDNDCKKFSFCPLVDERGFKSLHRLFGEGEHEFLVTISARDLLGRSFGQKLIHKVFYDGTSLEKTSITPLAK